MRKALLIFLSAPLLAFGQLNDNLVSMWELNETSGTTISDATGNNDGTLANATLNQTGILNKAVSFDGSGDYIELPIDEDGVIDVRYFSFSVSAWVKSADPLPSTTSVRILEKRDAGIGVYPVSWQVLAPSQDIRLAAYDGSVNPYPTISSAEIWDGDWHLIVMVCNFSTDSIYAYVDGAYHSRVLNTVSNATGNNGHIYLATNGAHATSWYSGLIDQVGLWTKALSASEVSDLYNSGIGIEYPFGEEPSSVGYPHTVMGIDSTDMYSIMGILRANIYSVSSITN